MMLRKALLLAPLLIAAPAMAHSPYLKPNMFTPDAKRGHVTVEASFAEGSLNPDVAMKADKWHAIAPDGTTVALTPAAALKDATYLEVPLAQPGTYRISSGERTGRLAKAALQGSNIRFLEGAEDKPWPSEKLIEVQSVTRADVYVVHGKPSALPAPASDFGIYPVSDPSDAYTGEVIRVKVLRDGKPVKDARVIVEDAQERYAAKKAAPAEVVTDADGEARITAGAAGLYLLLTRVRAPSATNPNLWISNTATLTLEVLPQ